MAAIESFFDKLLDKGGSDLHLSAGHPPTIRRRGVLEPLDEPVLDRATLEALMYEIIEERRRHDFEARGDLDFAYAYADKARFRASYLKKTTGIGAVFRTIPGEIPSVEQLGLPEAVVSLADRPSGLVLVTGPGGSGRSTTLATLISRINRSRDGHILTIEEPVEFVHEPARCQVTHREVGVDTPSVADALRSAGREDADVILVGDLRGQEPMRLALQLAHFGVLVLAAVGTNSTAGTIARFVSTFPAAQQPAIRGMLSEALVGIVAQQLVRTKDGTTRVAVHEILISNTGIAAAIRESKASMIPSLIQGGRRDGMQTMDSALEKLVHAGTISAADALDKALDKESFSKIPTVAAGL